MHRSLTAAFLALSPVGMLSFVPIASAQSREIPASDSLFHRELAPHGRWFQHPRFGWAWFPTEVDSQWRPYARGQWIWTEPHGWYWSSDEPFGWATYHYGRWGYDETYGWVWIPGNTWGPAWVAFRYSEGHVGWAPLPPETLGLSYGFASRHTEMSASYYTPRWVFVPRHRFLDARLYTSVAPLSQNGVYLGQSANVTNYVTVDNVIINRSIDRQRIEAAIGRRIDVVRVRDVDEPRKSGRRGDTEIEAFRPEMRMTLDATPPESARAKPGDKPRHAIHKDATPPSERRVQLEQQATPRPAVRPEGETEPPRTDQDQHNNERRGERSGMAPVNPPALGPPTDTPTDRDGKSQLTEPPAKANPSAPPSRVQTQPLPGAAPPAKKVDGDDKKDEKSKDARPGR